MKLNGPEKKKKKTNAERCREYRLALKDDPAYKEANKLRARRNRMRPKTEEQLQLEKEKNRLRQQRYRLVFYCVSI